MVITKTKLKNLEKKIKQKTNKSVNNELIIPSNWADFARMTSVRSGDAIIKFDPYGYQLNLVNIMLERSVIVAKSRQLGISETITSFMLWRACLNPGYLGVIFSKTQVDTGLLARRMKRMIVSLGLKTTTENLGDIEIEGRGRILFKNSNPDAARGIESVVDVFFDEFAFVDDAKFIYDAVTPAQQMVGAKARVFVVSTPNRKANFYWDLLSGGNGSIDVELLCKNMSAGVEKPYQYWIDSGDWGKVLIHWKEHPIYGGNPNFLQEIHEKKKLTWETIKQEYDLDFEESVENVFDAALVRKNAIGIYEETLDNDADYYAGLDTSTTGNDYCTLPIIKYKKGEYSLVHLYRKRQQTAEYHLYHIGEILKIYKPRVTGIEITGGVGTLYLEQLTKQLPSLDFQAVRTTGDSKPLMVSTLILALEKEVFCYPSNCPIVDEMLSFRRDGKKLEAAPGKHDDTIMGVAFALAVSPFNEQKPLVDFTKIKLINNIQEFF